MLSCVFINYVYFGSGFCLIHDDITVNLRKLCFTLTEGSKGHLQDNEYQPGFPGIWLQREVGKAHLL